MGTVTTFPRAFIQHIPIAGYDPAPQAVPVTRLGCPYQPRPDHELIMARLRKKHSLRPDDLREIIPLH